MNNGRDIVYLVSIVVRHSYALHHDSQGGGVHDHGLHTVHSTLTSHHLERATRESGETEGRNAREW